MHLTVNRIARLKYSGDGRSRDVRWDDALPGFGVRIYPTGRKVYVVSYRNENGVKRLLALGEVEGFRDGLKGARRAAGGVKSGATNPERPVDPIADRSQRRLTLAELGDQWLSMRAGKRSPRYAYDCRRRFDLHLRPRWGSRAATAIKPADVTKLHAELTEQAGAYEANRVVSLGSTLYNFGIKGRGRRREDRAVALLPESASNPFEAVSFNREEERERWIDDDEIRALKDALDAVESPYVRALVWLYLLTGSRKRALLQARWTDVDWKRRQLRTVEKGNRVHWVPLTPPAITLLEGLPRMEDNPFIFPSERVAKAPMIEFRKAWDQVRHAAGLPGLRLHDLRRTVASWMIQDGESLELIAKALNHRDQRTTLRYARFADTHVRAALEKHAGRLTEKTAPKPKPDNVVPMPERRG